ncbi:hypothetical protein I79_021356 [Cricetulus griseus]|uniref:Uncharacterized protein n=1 Tax=Cricetulus griseus TaxID=10029 RepID=G3ICF9_CRIGR|nr:hypothetical protein I79_021356 [Cricetulus griseus]
MPLLSCLHSLLLRTPSLWDGAIHIQEVLHTHPCLKQPQTTQRFPLPIYGFIPS